MATILVVDDSVITQRLLSLLLTSQGHTVTTATNGRYALECLSTTRVDVVIADLSMPEMNGIALLQHMQADEHYKDIPVIVLTSSGMDRDRAAARIEGASSFLTKPFSSWELVETVNRALGLETARD